ncbi:S-adenosylmethionine:tRNA ribosyltransferase-isomerase [Marinilongibacter aquaticus]|uniref:S-adenosylmethionine:tRNA ribosyltransferase-isomerase n=1 Tax=Marinilongibacter aquaticus TaxID=2975157 RepID=UPI0021BD82F0|nr:S-adenosylmethionine:tRNA ribosyltransferase-isomerase [Marinilongibacter aquaticus]UBM57735.1 S-adenosylmethionine:tRNA ribosyltransferase-isomerase [Marinilongibacter aquaticus]
MNKDIRIADYDYPLPDARIAKYPVEPRDQSKLLVFEKGQIKAKVFTDLVATLPDDAFLVFNNTRVIPARLFFRKATGALIEIFLLHPVSHGGIVSQSMEATDEVVWECMIGNKKKWKGESLLQEVKTDEHSTVFQAELIDRENNQVRLKWDNDEVSFAELVKAFGQMPLPPYLNRETEDRDLETYQTVYAENEGAVAAPTAGLHFTESTFGDLVKRGIDTGYITLHVGAGTFQPVKVDNALSHEMHNEQMVFDKTFVEKLAQHSKNVIPVGTTSMRSLESLYWFGVRLIKENASHFFVPKLYPYQFENEEAIPVQEALKAILDHMEKNDLSKLIGETEIFILPGYVFRICRGIITNFHQPKSTLLLLISALVGENWRNIYEYALENDFRFLSYGDSSLLMP